MKGRLASTLLMLNCVGIPRDLLENRKPPGFRVAATTFIDAVRRAP